MLAKYDGNDEGKDRFKKMMGMHEEGEGGEVAAAADGAEAPQPVVEQPNEQQQVLQLKYN